MTLTSLSKDIAKEIRPPVKAELLKILSIEGKEAIGDPD